MGARRLIIEQENQIKRRKKTEERIITNKQKEQNVFNEYDKTHLGTMSFTTIIYLKIV